MSRYQASNNDLILGNVRTETLIVHRIELTLFGHTQMSFVLNQGLGQVTIHQSVQALLRLPGKFQISYFFALHLFRLRGQTNFLIYFCISLLAYKST